MSKLREAESTKVKSESVHPSKLSALGQTSSAKVKKEPLRLTKRNVLRKLKAAKIHDESPHAAEQIILRPTQPTKIAKPPRHVTTRSKKTYIFTIIVKKKSPRAAEKSTHFKFMQLPGEIRNIIYELAAPQRLIYCTHTKQCLAMRNSVNEQKNSSNKDKIEPDHETAMLSVSKAIHAEAKPIWNERSILAIDFTSPEVSPLCPRSFPSTYIPNFAVFEPTTGGLRPLHPTWVTQCLLEPGPCAAGHISKPKLDVFRNYEAAWTIGWGLVGHQARVASAEALAATLSGRKDILHLRIRILFPEYVFGRGCFQQIKEILSPFQDLVRGVRRATVEIGLRRVIVVSGNEYSRASAYCEEVAEAMMGTKRRHLL